MSEEKQSLKSSVWVTSAPLVVVLLLAVISQALTFYLVPTGQLNDDALFLLRAINLAYPHDFPELNNPTHYAAGWPLFLAPFLWISEHFYTVGRCVAVALTALTAVILFAMFREKERSLLLPFAVTLLFLNSQQILRIGSSVMSEPLSFFFTVLCLFASTRCSRWWQFALLGLAAAWCVSTRSESLAFVVAIAFALWRRGLKMANLSSFLLGFVACSFLLRSFLEVRAPHLGVALDFFKAKPNSEFWDYPLQFLSRNSSISLSSVFGSVHPSLLLLWLIPLAAVVYAVRLKGIGPCLSQASKEPVLVWLILFPAVLFIWPYFNARYWPLWTVICFGSACRVFAGKGQMVALGLLLLAQLPGAVTEYRLGPVAHKFQTQLYLPYYQSLGQAKRVMTLNNARVQIIAYVPTAEPIYRTDFQSIPIGMAHLDCDVVEWETSNRHVVTYDGRELRPFPTQALAALRASTIFEPFQTSAFSESFRLLADPESLKQAGTKYSQAMQASSPELRIQYLKEALDLVPDLPETRLAYAQALFAQDPESREAQSEMQELLQQYPYLQSQAEPTASSP